jgi:hypothetical protein
MRIDNGLVSAITHDIKLREIDRYCVPADWRVLTNIMTVFKGFFKVEMTTCRDLTTWHLLSRYFTAIVFIALLGTLLRILLTTFASFSFEIMEMKDVNYCTIKKLETDRMSSSQWMASIVSPEL